ncbi:unnamed protein product [Discosporangium mesarthrocarpum]
MNLFGKARSKPAPTGGADANSTIMKLRETLEMLNKREEHIQKKIKGQLLEAKAKSGTKDKRGALFALKRKKMYEGEINKINGARMTLESQIIALEGSTMNMNTFNAMRTGAKAMQEARGRLDVDQVDDVMDDIREEMDIAEQIGDAIARPAEDLFDDDALLEELDGLEKAELEEQLLQPPAIPSTAPTKVVTPEMPAAPTGQIYPAPEVPTRVPTVAVAEDEDARALRELEESMAL